MNVLVLSLVDTDLTPNLVPVKSVPHCVIVPRSILIKLPWSTFPPRFRYIYGSVPKVKGEEGQGRGERRTVRWRRRRRSAWTGGIYCEFTRKKKWGQRNEHTIDKEKNRSDYFDKGIPGNKKIFNFSSQMNAALFSVTLNVLNANGSITGVASKCRYINIHHISSSNTM